MQVVVTLGGRGASVRAPGQDGGWRARGQAAKTHLLTPVSAPAVLDGPEGDGRAWGQGSAERRESQGPPSLQPGPQALGPLHCLLWAYWATGTRGRAESKTGPPTTLPETGSSSGAWGRRPPIHNCSHLPPPWLSPPHLITLSPTIVSSGTGKPQTNIDKWVSSPRRHNNSYLVCA